MNQRRRRLMAHALCLGFWFPLGAADPFAPAHIVVTQDVVAEDIEPVGANLTTITGGTNFATNNFIFGSGFEPSITRYLVRVDAFGADWFAFDSDGGGVHMWDQNATGFGNGAQLWFYRIVDENGDPLAYAGGMQDETGADHVVALGEAHVPMPSTEFPLGGWIAEGSEGLMNRVYLDTGLIELAFGDYVVIQVKKTRLLATEIHPRLLTWFEDDVTVLRKPEAWTVDLVPHPGTLPPGFEEPGETCLMVTATNTDTGWIGQYLFHRYDEEEGQWYSQLQPGATYRAVAWMRQEGLVGGSVRFMSTGDYAALSQTTPWLVTDQWQLFTTDFVGPAYPSADPWHQPFGLEFTGPGTLWLDNFIVFRLDNSVDHEPFVPHQLGFDELMASFPESGKSLGMGVSALDCWLYSSLKGYVHQSFLGYSCGSYWTSHTMPRAGGFRRHAGWLALMLRNRHAQGSRMLNTQLTSVPTYDRSGEDIPLTSAYTLQGEGGNERVRSFPETRRRARWGQLWRRDDTRVHRVAV